MLYESKEPYLIWPQRAIAGVTFLDGRSFLGWLLTTAHKTIFSELRNILPTSAVNLLSEIAPVNAVRLLKTYLGSWRLVWDCYGSGTLMVKSRVLPFSNISFPWCHQIPKLRGFCRDPCLCSTLLHLKRIRCRMPRIRMPRVALTWFFCGLR